MKLIKTTKNHYIYELSKKEQEEVCGFKYALFLKSNYEDYKPNFKYDIGYQDWESDKLEEALLYAYNY